MTGGSRGKYSDILALQILTFYTQIGYFLYLVFGYTPVNTAKFLIDANLRVSIPAKLWISLVNSPLSAKLCIIAFLLVIAIFCIYSFYKSKNNLKFIAIISIINILFTISLLFLTIHIYTHLSQCGSYIESPPYWPYFGR